MEPLYSVIVPAYNEEHWLPQTLTAINAAMAAQPYPGELIVCNNNSTDTTATIAEQHGAKVVFESHNQISRARNTGARASTGRYLIFVDADTHISAELLATALDNLHSGKCCGGGALVSLDSHPTAGGRTGLWLWNQLSLRLRLAAGCFVYCRRDDFEALGGFSEAVYASEELWFSRNLHRRGRRRKMPFCIIRQYTAHSSGRKAQWYSNLKQLGLLIALFIFPFLVRYKRFCGFWYNRPGDDKKQQNR